MLSDGENKLEAMFDDACFAKVSDGGAVQS